MQKRSVIIVTVCGAILLLFVVIFGNSGFDLNKQDIGKETIPESSELPQEPSPSNVESTPLPPLQVTPEPPQATPIPVGKGSFELPIHGATGYTAIELNLRSGPNTQSAKIGSMAAGTAFQIIREEGDYWQVKNSDISGYIAHKFCMINLPDVIPSIVYDNTNTYSSKLVSSGKALPGITNHKLYDGKSYNERLGKEEFTMPILYATAKKICAAQQNALEQGNALIIYEAYRPYSVQRSVVESMETLSKQDSKVRKGIESGAWKVSWFISQGISNHQRGCAIDVSLVHVEQLERRTSGGYTYNFISDYTEYDMPTDIHELSVAAAAFRDPISSTSTTAWKNAEPAPAMNAAAFALQRYCTNAGLTPLASEWWHFNDLETYERIRNNSGRGEYVLTEILSVAPYAK